MGASGLSRPAHVAYAVSLYARHGVAIVTLGDPRSDGRPRRLLGTVRIPVGTEDLVGRTSLDTSLVILTAVGEALSALGGIAAAEPHRRPRRGPQGRPVILRGQMPLPIELVP